MDACSRPVTKKAPRPEEAACSDENILRFYGSPCVPVLETPVFPHFMPCAITNGSGGKFPNDSNKNTTAVLHTIPHWRLKRMHWMDMGFRFMDTKTDHIVLLYAILKLFSINSGYLFFWLTNSQLYSPRFSFFQLYVKEKFFPWGLLKACEKDVFVCALQIINHIWRSTNICRRKTQNFNTVL